MTTPGESGPVSAPRLRLNKSDKLKTRQDFDSLKQQGRRVQDPSFALLVIPDTANIRFGIICSRKFHKNAVVRNRARRILTEAIRLLKPRMLSCRILLIPRRKICSMTMPQIQNNLQHALLNAGVLMSSPVSGSGAARPDSC